MQDYEEKRDFIRMQTNCKMVYRFADTNELHDAFCLNLSGAGILFRAQQSIMAGKALDVRIMPENRMTPPLSALVEVIRSEANNEGEYIVAATITAIKPD